MPDETAEDPKTFLESDVEHIREDIINQITQLLHDKRGLISTLGLLSQPRRTAKANNFH